MNYYIIPTTKLTKIDVKLCFIDDKIEPHISHSLSFFMNNNNNVLLNLKNVSTNQMDYINKMINPYEFINSNIPGSTISVSKVKPESAIFFELMELFQVFNVSDLLSLKNNLNIAHLTHNHTSTTYLLNMFREENNDNVISEVFDYEKITNIFIKQTYPNKLDLIICEFNETEYNNVNQYINNILLIFVIVLKYQQNQGYCVIKLETIHYKPIIDIIYLMSGMYDKMYLIKPSISNITRGDRYLICKGFNEEQTKLFDTNNFITNKFVSSIINNNIPCYFLNRLEESSLVIGQQQLEAFDLLLTIFKNKNNEEKLENLKRNHIQKCIQWCEKNQLPHNKFIDQLNIFLSPNKVTTE